MKNRIVFGGLTTILGLLIALIPAFIFPVCDVGDMPMKCHWSAQAELGVGIIIFVLGILLIAFKSKHFQLGISIASILNGIFALVIPNILIGMCVKEHMKCRSLTSPALSVVSVLIIVINIINIVLIYRAIKKDGGQDEA